MTKEYGKEHVEGAPKNISEMERVKSTATTMTALDMDFYGYR